MKISVKHAGLMMLAGVLSAELHAGGLGPSYGGITFGLKRSDDLSALQGDLMMEGPLNHDLALRGGVAFLVSEETDLHLGLEGGIRTRRGRGVSPFFGGGLFIGEWSEFVPADADGLDNDGDGFVDEYGEEEEVYDYLAAIYPEVGVHIQLADSLYLTGNYRYYITTRGRGSDQRLYGLELGVGF